MLKILHIIDSGGFYGAEVMLVTLAREQQLMGLHPVIASIGEVGIEEKPLEIAAKEAGIPVKIFRMAPGLNIRGVREVLAYREVEHFLAERAMLRVKHKYSSLKMARAYNSIYLGVLGTKV